MASLDAHLVAWQARDVVPCRAKIVRAGRTPVEADVIVVAGAGEAGEEPNHPHNQTTPPKPAHFNPSMPTPPCHLRQACFL